MLLPCRRQLHDLPGDHRPTEERRAVPGPFLEGFSIPDSAAFEEWRLLTREQLHRQVRQVLYLLAEAHRDQGEHEAALQYAWRQVEMDPGRRARTGR